jgi:ribonuclease G
VSEDAKAPSGEEPGTAHDAGGDEPAQASASEAGAGLSGAPRRRRGTRGGRGRRKPAEAPVVGEPGGDTSSGVNPNAGTGREQPTHPKRRRRGGRRSSPLAVASESGATSLREAVPEVVAQEHSEASSGASHEVAEASAGAVAAVPGQPSASRHRHRGSRGGRRRHKAVDAEHAEVVREAEEAAGETSGGTIETVGQSVPSPERKPARRRRKSRSDATRGEAEHGTLDGAAPSPAEGSGAEASGEETPSGPADEGAAEGGAPAKRRRRGARGGRRRRAAGEETAPAEAESLEEDIADTPPTSPIPVKPSPRTREKRARGRERRRPAAIVRQDEGSGLGTAITMPSARSLGVVADQPERKIILVTDDGQELRVALVEDGRLAEIYVERPDKKSYLGDIYQGRVENVLGGIDAAFVDFGLEKNGFLYVDEVTAPEGEKRARRIVDALKNGQQVLVQVTKDPMGSKGARLSTKISLAGRYLVYVPGGSGVGVSRRLGQGERDRLRDISKELKPKDAGLIVRTIAEGHGLEDLKRDLRYLSRLWSRLSKKAETVKAPGLVHKEVDISIEVARDMFNDTCEILIIDDPKRHKAIVSFLDKEAPELLPKVHLHDGSEPLFEAYGIEEQIAQALERRVPLPSGGNLVIDHAEALTVIDVNTGRFTRGKGLEDTITKTNLEAAREVVRQLRLRDIGGIIIIDFIDMAHAKNREMVLATLEAELETDRTKTYVVELSPLGLVEMTRQNTTDGARGILTRTCPTCLGKARVLSEQTMALNVERRVRALARKSQAKAWLIEVCGGVADRLSGDRLKRLEKQTGRRVFLEGSAALPVDSFHVLAEGSPAHVQEQRIPLREGQEVEVELEFSLTYSPRDAVGYVDGYMVIVEGGRQYVGKRRKVRVTNTARTGAQATVLK